MIVIKAFYNIMGQTYAPDVINFSFFPLYQNSLTIHAGDKFFITIKLITSCQFPLHRTYYAPIHAIGKGN